MERNASVFLVHFVSRISGEEKKEGLKAWEPGVVGGTYSSR